MRSQQEQLPPVLCHPEHRLKAIMDVEPAVDGVEVMLHGMTAHAEPSGDFFVVCSAAHLRKDLSLTASKPRAVEEDCEPLGLVAEHALPMRAPGDRSLSLEQSPNPSDKMSQAVLDVEQPPHLVLQQIRRYLLPP